MNTARQHPLLCVVDKVSVDSLPVTMRHHAHSAALEDARALIVFLQGVCAENAVPTGGNEGLLLVLELLQDKLEIGMGRYRFPFLSHEDGAPSLVARE